MAKTPTSDPTDVPDGVPEERVDALYGLPLDEFTPARDALAKELRQDGRGEDAGWVKGLRKPSAPAWVANQLARTQAAEVKELRAAGQALQELHERLLAGEGRPDELNRAAERHHAAVAALLGKAEGLLDSGGHAPSPATLEKARQTLEAVGVDAEARAAFEVGRLTRERQAVGLGLMGGVAAAPKDAKPRPRKESQTREDAEARRRAELRKALEAAREEEHEQRQAVERAQGEVDEARRELEQAEARRKSAEEELEQVRARHEQAAARVEDLKKELGQRA